jgi:hypothetical protein
VNNSDLETPQPDYLCAFFGTAAEVDAALLAPSISTLPVAGRGGTDRYCYLVLAVPHWPVAERPGPSGALAAWANDLALAGAHEVYLGGDGRMDATLVGP